MSRLHDITFNDNIQGKKCIQFNTWLEFPSQIIKIESKQYSLEVPVLYEYFLVLIFYSTTFQRDLLAFVMYYIYLIVIVIDSLVVLQIWINTK